MKSNWQNSTHKNIATTNFWNEKWKAGHTGWDIGGASPPILDYLSQYKNKEVAILIPGCGNAHEAKYLSENGFKNITLLDIAPEAVSRLKRNFEDKPEIKILCKDFFNHQGNYDLIIEQTFFCALLPEKRKEYVQKIGIMDKN